MFETIVTVVGYVITEPRLRRTPGGNRVTSFRVVSTSRRFDKDSEEWVNGDQVFATVNCWHRLADGVAEEMRKSDPVVVTGRMRTRDYEVGGQWRSAVEIDANAIGLDLARQRRKDDPPGFRHDDPAGWNVGLRHDEPSAVREAELVGVGHGASVAAGQGVSTEASRNRSARASPVPSAGVGRDRAAGGGRADGLAQPVPLGLHGARGMPGARAPGPPPTVFEESADEKRIPA
ncbi:single-strand DNA-binding protein [Saccharopolyspora erythraea NRRL 2338]|uniref:Single-strand binding protein n=2 Tax=Saccharopolyspora erythraea TaxID=1836 RepID=A4F9C0_SACEN|nr:single-stranded DNA-binding protein [Saccharopolyspora erythraea]EQD86587.1 single-stranded DNA-binding protein [Saccharopolyspora erythraea D]PFG94433.1 single-strand DNA-binding protein [Saccharopolyspora erythraea NRRL 2338]QRK91193.1 single-stranded DNA-binding protein [Saccharopolyspora erythraea]CAM00645.1 single-strand binding protein [Saccharopolyspora erythraea NRRL 2338]